MQECVLKGVLRIPLADSIGGTFLLTVQGLRGRWVQLLCPILVEVRLSEDQQSHPFESRGLSVYSSCFFGSVTPGASMVILCHHCMVSKYLTVTRRNSVYWD